MPVLNLDLVAPATVDIQCGEQMWQLRADVPTSILLRCFSLLELEEQRPTLDFDLDAPVDGARMRLLQAAMEAQEAEEEAQVLAILGAIWRWTYPGTPDEDLLAWLRPGERRQIVQAFFLILLARSGKLPAAPSAASSSTDSKSMTSEPTETMPAKRTKRTRKTAPSRTSRERDSIPSAMHSPADLSRSMTGEQINPTVTTTTATVAGTGRTRVSIS